MIMSSTSCGVRWGFVAAMNWSYRSNPNESEIENGIEIEIGVSIFFSFSRRKKREVREKRILMLSESEREGLRIEHGLA